MGAIVNFSVLLDGVRVYGIDLGSSSHTERIFDEVGRCMLRDAGRYHEHRWVDGRLQCFPLSETERDLQAAWDRLVTNCSIEPVALPDPTKGLPGQMGFVCPRCW